MAIGQKCPETIFGRLRESVMRPQGQSLRDILKEVEDLAVNLNMPRENTSIMKDESTAVRSTN